jgi:hypothetical protein
MKLFQQLSRNQLQTTESAVKESVKSICGNKAFVDGISQAMLAGTQKSLEQIFRKSLEDIMIPSYEKITHEMFQEMGKVFTQGTKDCELLNLMHEIHTNFSFNSRHASVRCLYQTIWSCSLPNDSVR